MTTTTRQADLTDDRRPGPAQRRRGDRRATSARTSHRHVGPPVDLAAAPATRHIAERLAAPGLHLIAEIKRSSPSAGAIAGSGEDIVARARAYETGGAAAISVLCEPHWFGGSIDDLRRVRAAVSIPVLAKEFVVDERQLAQLRRPVPTSCSSWPCSIRPGAWPASSRRRPLSDSSRWWKPTTSASCDPRWPPTRASSASNDRAPSSSTPRGPTACARSSPTIASSSPNPACATRRRSPAGGRSGSMGRSSARRSCARPIRSPRPAPSSRRVERRSIPPTWTAGPS